MAADLIPLKIQQRTAVSPYLGLELEREEGLGIAYQEAS